MAYKDPKHALADTIKIWDAISLFSNNIFDNLKTEYGLNTNLIEVIKREAVKQLNMDEGIINYCPLCDYYECSQHCFLSDPSDLETCTFGCTEHWSCKDFQECLLEKDWNKARENAKKFARELKEILK